MKHSELVTLRFRKAVRDDVSFIVQLLANDKLGAKREDYHNPLPEVYYTAFDKIDADANQQLIVVENDAAEIIGTLQLSFLQYLTYRGGIRVQIEAVRVREDMRGAGIGQQIFEWAIEHARKAGAHMVQLTTDKERPEAIQFYQKLGFKPSHEGMKLHLV
ncbi:GNAT family N-acetyltransferase [Ohtaekwangia kribbensis]|jgi:GNAT superfamily N-acetyltransferase|uniref:GNAT family N-acetyltransferase n=1 Tax=Ohtaekwangia kribbensis TaxID=688913 RepID=A0ABW3K3C3_9BACT